MNKSALTKKKLMELLQHLPDDAVIATRDRDCIACCEWVEIVGTKVKSSGEAYSDTELFVKSVKDIKDLYGGDMCKKSENIRLVLVGCD